MEGARFIELDFLPRTGFSDQRAGQGTPDPVARVQRMMVSDIPKAMRLEYALVPLLPTPRDHLQKRTLRRCAGAGEGAESRGGSANLLSCGDMIEWD